MASCLVYDPHLPTLGGGERYVVALAEALGRRVEVILATPVLPDPDRWRRLGFPEGLEPVLVPLEAFPRESARHDLAVYLANRLPLPSRARRSVLVVQFPFVGLDPEPRRRALALDRLAGYERVTYSRYVQGWLERRWGVGSRVIQPPVVLGSHDPAAKSPTIINVGRFFPGGHSKRQDALVAAFARLPAEVRATWRLVLVGAVGRDDAAQGYLAAVRSAAAGLPVDVLVDLPETELRERYAAASICWHAAGYGRPPDEPERAEHFGISVVEAMSWGAVPLVYDDGGPAEVVDDRWGARWRDLDGLVAATTALAADDGSRARAAAAAAAASLPYGRERFDAEVAALADDLLGAAV